MGIHKRLSRQLLLIAGLVLLTTCGVVSAQSVTQGYQSDQNLQDGMLVRLKPGNSTKVEALSSANISDMLGVVVSPSDSAVTLSDVGTTQQIFVATYGQYNVLVSTQNGPIKVGDFITISSLIGIGMSAENSQQLIIGKALKAFAGTTDAIGTTTLRSGSTTQQVGLGRIPVDISVSHNPLYVKSTTAGVPNFLYKAAKIVTDNPISAFRIYACLAILLISLFIAGGILYSGIHSGMTAIGRNPLAKKSLLRGLIQVILMSIIVFLIGTFAVYLLLKV